MHWPFGSALQSLHPRKTVLSTADSTLQSKSYIQSQWKQQPQPEQQPQQPQPEQQPQQPQPEQQPQQPQQPQPQPQQQSQQQQELLLSHDPSTSHPHTQSPIENTTSKSTVACSDSVSHSVTKNCRLEHSQQLPKLSVLSRSLHSTMASSEPLLMLFARDVSNSVPHSDDHYLTDHPASDFSSIRLAAAISGPACALLLIIGAVVSLYYKGFFAVDADEGINKEQSPNHPHLKQHHHQKHRHKSELEQDRHIRPRHRSIRSRRSVRHGTTGSSSRADAVGIHLRRLPSVVALTPTDGTMGSIRTTASVVSTGQAAATGGGGLPPPISVSSSMRKSTRALRTPTSSPLVLQQSQSRIQKQPSVYALPSSALTNGTLHTIASATAHGGSISSGTSKHYSLAHSMRLPYYGVPVTTNNGSAATLGVTETGLPSLFGGDSAYGYLSHPLPPPIPPVIPLPTANSQGHSPSLFQSGPDPSTATPMTIAVTSGSGSGGGSVMGGGSNSSYINGMKNNPNPNSLHPPTLTSFSRHDGTGLLGTPATLVASSNPTIQLEGRARMLTPPGSMMQDVGDTLQPPAPAKVGMSMLHLRWQAKQRALVAKAYAASTPVQQRQLQALLEELDGAKESDEYWTDETDSDADTEIDIGVDSDSDSDDQRETIAEYSEWLESVQGGPTASHLDLEGAFSGNQVESVEQMVLPVASLAYTRSRPQQQHARQGRSSKRLSSKVASRIGHGYRGHNPVVSFIHHTDSNSSMISGRPSHDQPNNRNRDSIHSNQPKHSAGAGHMQSEEQFRQQNQMLGSSISDSEFKSPRGMHIIGASEPSKSTWKLGGLKYVTREESRRIRAERRAAQQRRRSNRDSHSLLSRVSSTPAARHTKDQRKRSSRRSMLSSIGFSGEQSLGINSSEYESFHAW
ncbi:hypothetical protein BASA61_003063 [Batrachochytrium salamandrivorans]|nr:hypothetical protein BASA61_003063 [Batrachochytrium salamandrivorans]